MTEETIPPDRLETAADTAGLPPGSLVHVGNRPPEFTRITLLTQDAAGCRLQHVAPEEVGPQLLRRSAGTVEWLNVIGLQDVAAIERVGSLLGLHPLALEDILNTEERSRLEVGAQYIYVVLKAPDYEEGGDDAHAPRRVRLEQVSIAFGEGLVLSFQEREPDLFAPLVRRITNGAAAGRAVSADRGAYEMMDAIVDQYFVVLEDLGERLEELEVEVLERPDASTVEALHLLRSQLGLIRRSAWPLREMIGGLQREGEYAGGGQGLIREETRIYLRDAYDHAVQVMETVESFRETLAGLFDIYLSAISNRMNEIMKVLTLIATLFLPLTFVAGVYGMNFHHMPELGWRWGYPAALALMALIAAVMLLAFHRRRWL